MGVQAAIVRSVGSHCEGAVICTNVNATFHTTLLRKSLYFFDPIGSRFGNSMLDAWNARRTASAQQSELHTNSLSCYNRLLPCLSCLRTVASVVGSAIVEFSVVESAVVASTIGSAIGTVAGSSWSVGAFAK